MKDRKTTVLCDLSQVQYWIIAGMLVALGLVMPRVFHFAGPDAGKMFLPLFWSIGLGALVLPRKQTVVIAILVPCFSNLLTGMPPLPLLYFMLIELIVYALVIGIVRQYVHPAGAVLVGLLVSRLVYIGSVYIAAEWLHIPAPFGGVTALWTGVFISMPGICAQIILLPIIRNIYYKICANYYQ